MMKKKIIALLIILMGLSLLVVACGENPRGTFGPSWDVPFTIPLIEEREESVEDILDEQEDIQFEDDEIVYSDFDTFDLNEELDLSDELEQDFDEEFDLDDEFDMGDVDDLQDDFDFDIKESFEIDEGFEDQLETSFNISLDEPNLDGVDFDESFDIFGDQDLSQTLEDMSNQLGEKEDYTLDSDEVALDEFDFSEKIGEDELSEVAEEPTNEIENQINDAEVDPVPIAGQAIADEHDYDAELDDHKIESFEFDEFSSLEFAEGKIIVDFENDEDAPTIEQLEIKIESDGEVITSDELDEDLEAGASASIELDLAGEEISDELDLLLSLTTDDSNDVGELAIDTSIEDVEIKKVELKESTDLEVSDNLTPPDDFDLEWVEFEQGDLEIEFIIQDQDGNSVREELGLNPEEHFTLTFADEAGEEDKKVEFDQSTNPLSGETLYFDQIEIDYSEAVDTYLAGAEIKVDVGFSEDAEVAKAKLAEKTTVDETITSELEDLPEEVEKVELMGRLELVIDTGELDVDESITVELGEDELVFDNDPEDDTLRTHDLDRREIDGGEELSIDFSVETDTYIAGEEITVEFRVAEDKPLDIGQVTLKEGKVSDKITEEIDLELDPDEAKAIKAIVFSDDSKIVLDDGGLNLGDEDYGGNKMDLILPGQEDKSLLDGSQPLGRVEIDDNGELTVEVEYEIKTFDYDEDTEQVNISLEDLDWDYIEIDDYELDEEELDIDLLADADFERVDFEEGSKLIIEITPEPTEATITVNNGGEDKEFTIYEDDDGKWEIPLDDSNGGLNGISSEFEIKSVNYSGNYDKGKDITVETRLNEDGAIKDVKFDDGAVLSRREEIDLGDLPNQVKAVELTGGKLEFEVDDGDDDIVNVEELYLELPNGDRAKFETNAEQTEYTLDFSNPTILTKESDWEEEKDDVDNLILEKHGDEWTDMAVVFEADLGDDAFDEGGSVSIEGGLEGDLDFGRIGLEEDEFSEKVGFSLRDEIDEDFVNDLKSITFSDGKLEIEIKDGDLDFEIGLWINGEKIEKEDGKYTFSLEDETIEFSDDEDIDDIEIEIALNSFTYASKEDRSPVKISGGISDVDWKEIRISSDATDILDEFDLEERLDISELRQDFDEDLDKELNKIKGEDIELVLEIAGLANLGLQAELEVVAYDEHEEQVDNPVTISEENESFTFTEEIINLMLNDKTDHLKLKSSVDANGDDEDIVIEKFEELKPSLRLRTPIKLSLSEDIEHKIEPISIADEISSDDIERLEGVLKSARIEGRLDNQLPLGVEVEVYVGGIDESVAESNIDSELYKAENLISNLKADGEDGIKANREQQLEIAFDTAKADQFKEDNPYIGVKINLPADDEISFTTNDYIKISDLKAVFVAQANQRD